MFQGLVLVYNSYYVGRCYLESLVWKVLLLSRNDSKTSFPLVFQVWILNVSSCKW